METLILVAGPSLVIVHAAALMRPYMRSMRHASAADFCRRMWKKAYRLVVPATHKSSDPLDRLVDRRIELTRVSAAAVTYSVGAVPLCIGTASIVVHTATGAARWMTPYQTLILIIGLAILAVVNAAPSLIPRLLDALHGIFMVLMSLFVWWSSSEYFTFTTSWVLFFRLVISLGHLNIRQSLFWNLAGVAVNWVCISRHLALDDYGKKNIFYVYETATYIFVIIAMTAFKHMAIRAIRHEIQVGRLKTEISASGTLLEMVCDVVIELKRDMTIACDSRAMAALLMRSQTASIAGMSFTEFMSDEAEQHNFRDILQAAGTEPETSVGTCRVHLSDSLRNLVNVEVFIVRMNPYEEDDSRFILGIREFTDGVDPMPSFESRAPKRHHAVRSSKGTPRDVEPMDLPEIPAVQAPRQNAENLHRYPDLILTRTDMRCKEVLVAMTSWNIKIPRTVCCPFHAYVMDVKAIIRDSLSNMPCMANFPDASPSGVQCQECGTISPDEEEGQCCMCESRDLRPIPPRRQGAPCKAPLRHHL